MARQPYQGTRGPRVLVRGRSRSGTTAYAGRVNEPSEAPARPGERLMIVGAALTVLGMVLTFVAMVPLADSTVHLPSVFWGLAMVTGIGLAVLIFGIWRAARGRSERTRTALEEFHNNGR